MSTQQNTQSVCLAQVNGKVKRMWVKALFKSEPKINPNFALDMPTYKKTTDIHSFYPTVIHATYLYSNSHSCSDPQLQLHFDGTVTAFNTYRFTSYILFLIQVVIKLYSVRKFMNESKKHFQNFYEIPFFGETFYNCGKWTTNFCS